MHLGNLADATPFTTKDGSTIREVAGPVSLPTDNQSLAEATVPPTGATTAHLHHITEELYFFTAGRGRLRLGDEEREVRPGDCVVIPPGTPHKLFNDSATEDLTLLCCCAPAYSDADTELLEPEVDARPDTAT
jgi:mannose-6-phosphate isomerase-like protein (cupin superfamily)